MTELCNLEVFKTVVDHLPIGVYVVDAARKVTYWNAGAEHITGYLSQEVLGRSCQDNVLIHCDEQGILLCGDACPIVDAMRNGKIVEAVVLTQHRAGHRVPVQVCAVPLRNQSGAIIGAAESFQLHAAALAEENKDDFLPLDARSGLPEADFTAAYLRAKIASHTKGDPRRITVVRLDLVDVEQLRRTHGGEAVSALLRPLAETLRNAVRQPDYLGMWGEFGFLMILGASRENPPDLVGMRLKNLGSTATVNWWGDRLMPISEVNATTIRSGDTLESVIARLDLQRAANNTNAENSPAQGPELEG